MSILEGFQTSGLAGSDNRYSVEDSQSRHCPIYKINIDNNKKLLQEYKNMQAVISVENTQSLLDNFQKKYDEMNCEAYMNSVQNITAVETTVAPSTAATGSS